MDLIGRFAICLLLCLALYNTEAHPKGSQCRARHPMTGGDIDGICDDLPRCMRSLGGVFELRFPNFCGLRGFTPIVCCPKMEPPTPLTPVTIPTVVTFPPASPLPMKPSTAASNLNEKNVQAPITHPVNVPKKSRRSAEPATDDKSQLQREHTAVRCVDFSDLIDARGRLRCREDELPVEDRSGTARKKFSFPPKDLLRDIILSSIKDGYDPHSDSYHTRKENRSSEVQSGDVYSISVPSTTLTTDRSEGNCVTKTGIGGICHPLNDCPSQMRAAKNGDYPQFCSYNNMIPHVCCPDKLFPVAVPPPVTPAKEDSPVTSAEVDFNQPIEDPRSFEEKVQGLLSDSRIACRKKPKPRNTTTSVFVPVVYGGEDAKLGMFPWMAAIFRDRVDLLNFWCGGTAITTKFVLSAAHCFYGTTSDTEYIVRMGDLDISREDDGVSPEDFRVLSITLHPNYNDSLHYNDVALLHLDRYLPIKPTVGVACLPEDYDQEVKEDEPLYVIGWGHTSFGGRLSSKLQVASVPAVSNGRCDDSYKSLTNYESKFPHGIDFGFICAGNITTGDADACQQDSGGPLVRAREGRKKQEVYELVGVVSFGIGCGTPGYPGVYTRVYSFVRWIAETAVDVEEQHKNRNARCV